MENKYFDKYIKESLENFDAEFHPSDWNLMDQKIQNDPTLSADGIDDTSFDQIIKEQLEPIEIPIGPSDWSSFESKLDQAINTPVIEDTVLDDVAYDNLNNLRIPYNKAHWTLMSNRLDEEFSFRRKLYKYKVAEVALMILAIFTLLQFIPLKKQHQAKEQDRSTTTETNPIYSQNNTTTTIPTNQHQSSTVDAESPKTSTTKITSNLTTTSTPIHKTIAVDEIQSSPQTNSTPNLINSSSAHHELADLSKVISPVVEELNAEAQKQTHSAIQPITDAPTTTLTEESVYTIDANDLYTVFESFDMEPLDYDRPFSATLCSSCHKKGKAKLRFGMFLSTDLNKITTPGQSGKTEGYAQYSLDYGGGFTVGLKKGKWEFETGIAYNHLRYEPEITRIIAGSFLNGGYETQGFDRIDLNTLKVPVNVSYKFTNIGKWHIYALGGASLNLVAIDHYNVTTDQNSRPESAGFRAPSAPPTTPGFRDPIFLETTTFDGIFEGGNFSANHFYTANMGLGIERYLTPRWSIFVQPVYQYEFLKKGLGPNKDRIHTMSIQLGAKSSLK